MVVGPIGVSDWLAVRRLLSGVSLGWLAGLCCSLSKREYKEEGKMWRGQRQPCVLLSWVFGDHMGLLGTAIQPLVSKARLTLPVSSASYCALLPLDLCTPTKMAFFQSIQWVLGLSGQQDIYNVSAVCRALSAFSPSPQPQPHCPIQVYSVLRSWLSCHSLREAFPDHPSLLNQIRLAFEFKTPYASS